MAKRYDLREVNKAGPRDTFTFLLGLAAILIGLIFLGFQIPHLLELNRIRSGTAAAAKVEILELRRSTLGSGSGSSYSSERSSNSGGRYYIEARFTFTYEGVEYTGTNFTAFDEIFWRRDAAVNACATVTTGTPTAYFDPAHPQAAVLDTRLTLGGIRFLLIGCGFVSVGGALAWAACAQGEYASSIRIRKSRKGFRIAVLPPAGDSLPFWTLRAQYAIYFCLQVVAPPIPISPDWVWAMMLIPPALASAPTLWILIRARSPWSLELNDTRGTLEVLKRGVLGNRCICEVAYSSITDIDTVDRTDDRLGMCSLVMYVLSGSVSEATPLEWLQGSFTSCEQVRTLIRERMGESPLKLEPRNTE